MFPFVGLAPQPIVKIIVALRAGKSRTLHMQITLHFASFSDKIAFNLRNGIMPRDLIAEVTDPDAESLLDYITGPERLATRLLMKHHALAA